MSRFLLWSTVASVLSSVFLLPLAWRAVLVGLATAWAVRWTEREWARAEAAARSRAGMFIVRGVVAGLTVGLAITALDLILERCGLLWRGFGRGPTLAWHLALPVVTILSVLGVGWCHLNRKHARAWVLMLLALAVASLIRAIDMSVFGFGKTGIETEIVPWLQGALFCFFLGAMPFALLWLGAARMADR